MNFSKGSLHSVAKSVATQIAKKNVMIALAQRSMRFKKESTDASVRPGDDYCATEPRLIP